MKTVHIDFETRSRIALDETNVSVYAGDESTELLCMAYAYDDGPIRIWLPGDPFPFKKGISQRFMAWNAEFELEVWNAVCTRLYDWPEIGPDNIYCVLAISAYYGYSRKLDTAAATFGMKKWKKGHEAMMTCTKPKRAKKFGNRYVGGEFVPFEGVLKRMVLKYCRHDVKIEREIFDKLGDVPDQVRRQWLSHYEIAQTGIPVDIEFVRSANGLYQAEAAMATERLSKITDGRVTTADQRERIINELESEGIVLPEWEANGIYKPNLQEDTVAANLDKHELLRIRYTCKNASPRKYASILNHLSPDGVCRNQYLFYGAGTGRSSATGVQFQNFFKRRKKADRMVIDAIRAGDRTTLAALYNGEVIHALSEYVRSSIMPFPGEKLVVADLSQVEARITFWLAGEDADFNGIYEQMAAEVYKIPVESIGKESNERQLGKAIILGCGFKMGAQKFKAQAAKWGVIITDEFAQFCVDAFRRKYTKIVALWDQLARAMRMTYERELERVRVGRLAFGYEDPSTVTVELPSGRKLYYRDVQPYDSRVLQYTSHKGVKMLTPSILIENPVQAIAADIFFAGALTIQEDGHKIVLHTHDEVGISVPLSTHKSDIEKAMSQSPPWASDLSVAVEAKERSRYYE